jgi:anti-sigma factor RsiW
MNAMLHLSADEIVARVFPEDGGPAAVPPHLAGCTACQERVARLREAWLLDRGAVSGYVDGLPESFWTAQAERTMEEIRSGAAPLAASSAEARAFRPRLLRHPFLAFGSLAAALILVATVTVSHIATKAPVVQSAVVERPTPSPVDRSDEELLRAIDRVLDDSSLSRLAPEDTL